MKVIVTISHWTILGLRTEKLGAVFAEKNSIRRHLDRAPCLSDQVLATTHKSSRQHGPYGSIYPEGGACRALPGSLRPAPLLLHIRGRIRSQFLGECLRDLAAFWSAIREHRRIKILSSYTQNSPDYFPKWARSFSFSLQYISKRSVSGRSSWGILIVKGLLYI